MINIMNWRKSSYSSDNGGNCVEVGTADRVMVRDTKQAGTGPVLGFTPDAWRTFANQVKRSLASDSRPTLRICVSASPPLLCVQRRYNGPRQWRITRRMGGR
jgi:hypothetical protein